MVEYKTYSPKVVVFNRKVNGQEYDLSPSVRRIQKQGDDLGNPTPTYSIELIPKNTPDQAVTWETPQSVAFWRKTLKKNDIIMFGIEEPQSFIFRVDGIFEIKRSTINGIEKGLQLVGRSLISVLLDDDATKCPNLRIDNQTGQKAQEILGRARTEFMGMMKGLGSDGSNIFNDTNPLVPIMWILAVMPAIQLNVEFADHDNAGTIIRSTMTKIGSLLGFDLKAYRADKVYNLALNQYAGKIWNYFTQCVDPLFYEVFEECKKDEWGTLRPTIVIRPKPFDKVTDRSESVDDNGNSVRDEVIAPYLEDFSFIKTDLVNDKITDVGELTATKTDVNFSGLKVTLNTDDPNVNTVNWYWEDSENANTDYKTAITKEKFHTLPEQEEYANQIGTSTNEVVNYFTVTPSSDVLGNSAIAQYGDLFPIIDGYSIKLYGVRTMNVVSRLVKVTTLKTKTTLKDGTVQKDYTMAGLTTYVNQRNRLFSWYRMNPEFQNGSVKCLGHDYYRKGDKIFIPHHTLASGQKGVYYYIQGHDFEFMVDEKKTSYISTLKLVRGENPEFTKLYNYGSGYDLFDNNQEQDGERKNPIITISQALNNGNNTSSGTTSEKEVINDTKKDGSIDGDGSYPLTEKSLQLLESKFNQYKSEYTSRKDLSGNPITLEAVITAFQQAGGTYGINPNVLVGIANHESGLRPVIVNHSNPPSNASGVGQFLYSSAKGITYFKSLSHNKPGVLPPSSDDRLNPVRSIWGMAEHLKRDKHWGKTLESKQRAIKNYGEGTNSYLSLIRSSVKELIPETEL